ncbi:unnamed protein product [Boreogadus saida]
MGSGVTTAGKGHTALRAGEEIAASVVMTEHDYGSAPTPGALDAAAARIQQLEETVKELTRAVTAEVQRNEFFLFCCRVAAGLQEKVLADMFQSSSEFLFTAV